MKVLFMKTFAPNRGSKELYHAHAKNQPIIDYHCH